MSIQISKVNGSGAQERRMATRCLLHPHTRSRLLAAKWFQASPGPPHSGCGKRGKRGLRPNENLYMRRKQEEFVNLLHAALLIGYQLANGLWRAAWSACIVRTDDVLSPPSPPPPSVINTLRCASLVFLHISRSGRPGLLEAAWLAAFGRCLQASSSRVDSFAPYPSFGIAPSHCALAPRLGCHVFSQFRISPNCGQRHA